MIMIGEDLNRLKYAFQAAFIGLTALGGIPTFGMMTPAQTPLTHYPFGFAKACPVLPDKALTPEEEEAVFDFLMKMHTEVATGRTHYMRILEANIEKEQKKNQQAQAEQERDALEFVTKVREEALTEYIHDLMQLTNEFKEHEKEQKKQLQAKQEDETPHTQLVGKPKTPDLCKVVK